jgi:hypothetical protein
MGERGQGHAPAVFIPPGKVTRYPSYRSLGGPQTKRLEEKSSASVGDRTEAMQVVVRHYSDWATPAHTECRVTIIKLGSSEDMIANVRFNILTAVTILIMFFWI